jgi:glucose-6-phosphate 1-dehydrogenase
MIDVGEWMEKQNQEHQPLLFVLFGATGDLAKRKLFPALYSLHKERLLPEQFAVVGVARGENSDEGFRSDVLSAIQKYARHDVHEQEDWEAFSKHFYYFPLDVRQKDGYTGLKDLSDKLDQQYNIPGNRIFFLAMAPEFFGTVASNLKAAGLTGTPGWKRLIIEKPFGHDLPSAQQLNQEISAAFAEEDIYRIDHYLGKEMVQNIEVIRFANTLFEPLWNNRYIDNIQITSSETVGVEERAGYYEKSGALRDMVQNHMLQMVMMMAMEPPSRLKTEAIRDEKVKVLRSLRRYTPDEVRQHVVRGQYAAGSIQGKAVPGYREETGVDPQSRTETFVAAKLYIDNFRWAGVPFYIRTGKRMARKSTEIVVQFKEMPKYLYFNKEGTLGPNLLVIRVNPVEGMHLLLNVKQPGTEGGITRVAMDFCQNCEYGNPEAYERLLYDAMHGDSTFFTRWDEVSLAWKFVDAISAAWESNADDLRTYAAGTWGPEEANQLLQRDGFHWWPVSGTASEPGELKSIQQIHKVVEVFS